MKSSVRVCLDERIILLTDQCLRSYVRRKHKRKHKQEHKKMCEPGQRKHKRKHKKKKRFPSPYACACVEFTPRTFSCAYTCTSAYVMLASYVSTSLNACWYLLCLSVFVFICCRFFFSVHNNFKKEVYGRLFRLRVQKELVLFGRPKNVAGLASFPQSGSHFV